MTRARAKLLEQQVNSLLAQPDLCYGENFILPKSMHLCMIRFEEQLDMEAMELNKELDMEDKELDMEDKQLDMEDKLQSMKITSRMREGGEGGRRTTSSKVQQAVQSIIQSPVKDRPRDRPVTLRTNPGTDLQH